MASISATRFLLFSSFAFWAARAQPTTPAPTSSPSGSTAITDSTGTITPAPSATSYNEPPFERWESMKPEAASYYLDQEYHDSENRANAVGAKLWTYFGQHHLFDNDRFVTNEAEQLSADQYFITELPTTLQPYATSFLSVWASLQGATPNASDSARLNRVAATANAPVTTPASSQNAAGTGMSSDAAFAAVACIAAGAFGFF